MALFGFLGGKKTSVGLDIGSGIIKLVVIDHSGSEPELAKVATTEVAADAIVEGEVMDPGIVAEAIRGLFSAAGVKQSVAGLLNIGHEVTNVNILEDGVPVLTRDLSVGTRRFREDLQREKGLSAEDAERVIQGLTHSADLAPYVEARGEEIAVGVERAAAFLATASRSAGGLGRVYTIGGVVLLFFTQTARLRVAEARLDGVRTEKRRFDAVIAQKRQSEKIRDSLVAEINVIRGIDADRYIWPHILDQVTKALPPYTWLDGISAQGVGVGGQPA